MKDVFRRELLLSDQEREELAEFDRAYVIRTPTVGQCVEAATLAGLTSIRTRDLSEVVSTAHARRAMFDAARAGTPCSFGRLHDRRHSCLPVYFAELTARTRAA